MKQSIELKKYILIILALVILATLSKVMLLGTGNAHPTVREITLVCFLIIILSSSNKAYWYIGFPIIIVNALYTPIGLNFGEPTYQYISSVVATDAMESQEFFTQIPIKNYLFAIFIIVAFIYYRKMTIKNGIFFYKNKTLLVCLAIIALINQSPFKFFDNIYHSILNVKNEVNNLNEFTKKSEWGDSTLKVGTPQYDDYVLIIGESVRRDYMNAYGYPIKNTPFISKTNGIIVEGLTSGGTNTVASLRIMLTQSQKDEWLPNYGLNFVDLAKSAGYKVYWLSNQGFLGEFDTPITFIAKRSDIKKFNKMGAFNSKDTSDFSLVNVFQQELDERVSKKQKRLFVIHLYGSHPDACARIEDYKNNYRTKDNQFNNISCYVASIEKTDKILGLIYNSLKEQQKQTHRSFSMLYFADHGLSHSLIDDQIKLNLSHVSAKVLNIPLMMFNSDSNTKEIIKSYKSGKLFTAGLANWLNIKNKKIDPNYSLFSSYNDDNLDIFKNKFNELRDGEEDDLPIDIREK
ncbi:phosphoethanolamine transferase [Providencia rettgeri]|uniref:phosphoethanolamine transferase n=4 Tax=Providencia rettgeri TaxID=587 RepID=UPI001B3814C3|nr:phosphoethanolamine transferase [Providencia rettgeri]EJD6508784.1 phosphoethanolamine transferase [Providencia rettgeri]MBQ0352105.1 phosphoethanolamine transferase [Providencia rettgeri]MBQ0405105.1 phosphoethanolamine transferase [Providencia rettgeri]MCJ2227127.1 phosphoethanolamine transferase [Providencia rettgeri]